MRRLRCWKICCLLATIMGSHPATAEPHWPSGTYSYVVVDQDLRDVLQQFGANTGLKVALSDKVQGRVHGPLPSASPKEFLSDLAQQFGLEWVYDGSIIAVSANVEDRTDIVPLHGVPFDKLRDGLAAAGFLDPRFVFKPVMDGHAALVSGPPRYIGLLHDALAAFPEEKAPPPPAAEPVAAPAKPAPPPRSMMVMRGGASNVVEFKR